MATKPVKLFIGLLVPLLLAGCQSLEMRRASVGLENTLNRYETITRWGSLQQLYGFLDPGLAASTPVPDGLENIRVTHYEVVQGPLKPDPLHATQTAAIAYVLRDRQVEHRLLDRQQWTLEPKSGRWYRSNPIPRFK